MANYRDLEGMEEEETTSTHKIRTNHLLVIAIDEYENGIQDLNNAVRDAEAVKEILWKSYQFSPENTKVLINKDATRHNIISAFEGFIEKLTPEDNFLFYFSGHGDMYKPTKRGFWIPADGKPRSRSSWLSNNDIRDFMEYMQAHHVFGIVDSCFSGALFRKNAQENENTLKYLDSYPSRWLLTAGRETIVPDGVPGTHSPFAKTLISQLSHNPEMAFAVSKLCSDVIMSPAIDKVNAKPRGSALPLSSSQGGQFIFYKKGFKANTETTETSSSMPTRNIIPEEIEVKEIPKKPKGNIIDQIKELIAMDEMEEAMDLIEEKISSEARINKDLFLLKSRYFRMMKDKNRGTISDDNFSINHAKLTQALLSYVNDVKKEDIL